MWPERIVRAVFAHGKAAAKSDAPLVSTRPEGEERCDLDYFNCRPTHLGTDPDSAIVIEKLEYVAVYAVLRNHDVLYVPPWVQRLAGHRDGDMIRELAACMDLGLF